MVEILLAQILVAALLTRYRPHHQAVDFVVLRKGSVLIGWIERVIIVTFVVVLACHFWLRL